MHETLAGALLGASGALVAACIAAYAVWLQLRLSLYSREEDRFEKLLPAYIEAAQVLSDYVVKTPALLQAGNLASIRAEIDGVPDYIRFRMISGDESLKSNTEGLVNAFLHAMANNIVAHSDATQWSYDSMFSILSGRQQYLSERLQLMERRRRIYRQKIDEFVGV